MTFPGNIPRQRNISQPTYMCILTRSARCPRCRFAAKLPSAALTTALRLRIGRDLGFEGSGAGDEDNGARFCFRGEQLLRFGASFRFSSPPAFWLLLCLFIKLVNRLENLTLILCLKRRTRRDAGEGGKDFKSTWKMKWCSICQIL